MSLPQTGSEGSLVRIRPGSLPDGLKTPTLDTDIPDQWGGGFFDLYYSRCSSGNAGVDCFAIDANIKGNICIIYSPLLRIFFDLLGIFLIAVGQIGHIDKRDMPGTRPGTSLTCGQIGHTDSYARIFQNIREHSIDRKQRSSYNVRVSIASC